MADTCGEVYDSSDEYNRDERVETIYQGWGAREMAERIVDLEDELGKEIDGISTGMHADVAEAHAEIERQASQLRQMEGDCIRLSEELDESRSLGDELAKDARDGAHWEAVADRMRDEIARLKDLLAYEHNRANSAIDREETAEKAAEEAQADAQFFEAWATGNGHRLNAMTADRDRVLLAWQSARRRAKTAKGAWRAAQHFSESWRHMFRRESDLTRELLSLAVQRVGERDRYRLAWLSARRRAADEANFGMEALELKNAEVSRLTFLFRHAQERADNLAAENERLRTSTQPAPRLEHVGTEEDGGAVWQLLCTTDDGHDVYIAPVGTPAP